MASFNMRLVMVEVVVSGDDLQDRGNPIFSRRPFSVVDPSLTNSILQAGVRGGEYTVINLSCCNRIELSNTVIKIWRETRQRTEEYNWWEKGLGRGGFFCGFSQVHQYAGLCVFAVCVSKSVFV